MKLLLTSSGIINNSIHQALIQLLGKPIEECNALFIPTAIYPFRNGAYMMMNALNGKAKSPLCQLGWKSLGLLELTALPSIKQEAWMPSIQETDVLLVWGGDPLYLSYWLQESGLAELLPSLNKLVYVGVSAGSMAACTIIGATYPDPPFGVNKPLTTKEITLSTPQGDINNIFIGAKGAGWVNFSIIPHMDNPDHAHTSQVNAEKCATMIPAPIYAIDDQTAIKVDDGMVEVISEGKWKLFNA
jgi:dipeptidase E